jgi:hypothetical protein
MSDMYDLLQKMMQNNMQLPKMAAPSQIPGMQYANGAQNGKTLFDLINQYQNGQKTGGVFGGARSLFGPQSDPNAAVDDTGAVIPSAPTGAQSGKGGASSATPGLSTAGNGAGKGGGVSAG